MSFLRMTSDGSSHGVVLLQVSLRKRVCNTCLSIHDHGYHWVAVSQPSLIIHGVNSLDHREIGRFQPWQHWRVKLHGRVDLIYCFSFMKLPLRTSFLPHYSRCAEGELREPSDNSRFGIDIRRPIKTRIDNQASAGDLVTAMGSTNNLSLEGLTARIASSSKVISECISQNNLGPLTFDANGPATFPIPSHHVEVHVARQQLIEAAMLLERLVRGPNEYSYLIASAVSQTFIYNWSNHGTSTFQLMIFSTWTPPI